MAVSSLSRPPVPLSAVAANSSGKQNDLPGAMKWDEVSSEMPRTELIGYVYVLVIDAMPGLLKVGFTTRTIEERLRELSAPTGVPGDFCCIAYIMCTRPDVLEEDVHSRLMQYRRGTSEFFSAPPRIVFDSVGKSLAALHVKTYRSWISSEFSPASSDFATSEWGRSAF
jgi:hypothetical protein